MGYKPYVKRKDRNKGKASAKKQVEIEEILEIYWALRE